MLGHYSQDAIVAPAIDLSIVAPIFNEEENIPELLRRLQLVAESVSAKHEIILVDDGSRDSSWALIQAAANNDARIKAISFSRNFGHQIAITAGMDIAQGAHVAIIDADLQDPPELIPDLLKKAREGYDIVYAMRLKREGESWAKLLTARVFYRIIQRMTSIHIPVDTGDFRLMSRRAVQAFLAMPERHRFVRGMVSWVGFSQVGIHYDRAERFQGVTKYTYRKMFRFAFDGITSFSYLPLQVASYLGFLCAGISFILILAAIFVKFFNNQAIQGWASMVVATLFLGGIQLIMIGLMGEYLGRIHDELKKRPLYIVKAATNL